MWNMINNYAADALDRLHNHLPDEHDELLRAYALLVLVKGEEVTLADVHDAWSLWLSRTEPDHHSIVDFDELSPGVQELNRPYAEAIAEVAREIMSFQEQEDR